MTDLRPITEAISTRRRTVTAGHSMLIAISGIDGSGKGYVAERLVGELRTQRVNSVVVNVDGWLNLPAGRFSAQQPAEHFYHHAIRFEEMFEQLILPLKRQRGIHLEMDFTEETAQQYRKHICDFRDVDVIVLEGIFLLKRAFLHYYDWTMWIDCGFETALERALRRGQEGLPQDETIRAYRTIYFPAQELHFRMDRPRETANVILVNDPRLGSAGINAALGGAGRATDVQESTG